MKTKNKKTIYPKKANPSPGTGPEKGMRLGLKKGGGDLLSRLRSTIGAVGLNFSVRNGKRWDTNAVATIMTDIRTTRNPLLTSICRHSSRTVRTTGTQPMAARPQVSGN